jgi:hypothetical protein
MVFKMIMKLSGCLGLKNLEKFFIVIYHILVPILLRFAITIEHEFTMFIL